MWFAVLGHLDIVDDARHLTIGSPKQRAVLAALVLFANQTVSTARLVGAVWGDEPPASARNLLQTYVWRLRGVLDSGSSPDPRIISRPDGYQLNVGPDELDTIAFEKLAAQGTALLARGDMGRAATVLRDALALWRGDAAEDVPLYGCAGSELLRLAERRMAVLETRVDADLGCGRHSALVAELASLTAEHPLRERLVGQLMLALVRSGRRGDALAAFRAARMALAQELGLDPDAELQRLHQAILRGESDAWPPARPGFDPDVGVSPDRPAAGTASSGPDLAELLVHQLPPDLPDYVDRPELGELTAAARVAEAAAVPVTVTVCGTAGVGKTVLAVHAAHLLRARFPGGQLFANLHGLSADRPAPRELQARFLRAMNVPAKQIPNDLDEATALYRSVLADRVLLVVLDDAADEAQVRPLLPTAPGSLAVVTSRNRLGALAAARVVDLDMFTPKQSVTLLRRITGTQRISRQWPAVGHLLAACGHLPLAVRIVGARLAARPQWSVADLAGRLDQEQRRLDTLATGDLRVRAALALSYHALDEPQRRLFRRLAWQPAPEFGTVATAALGDCAPEEAETGLDRLADASLLRAVSAGRFRLHDLVRLYAAEAAAAEESPAEHEAALRRLLLWYVHTVTAADAFIAPQRGHRPIEAADPRLTLPVFTNIRQASNWLDAERAALVAVVGLGTEHGIHEMTWRLALRLVSYFDHRADLVGWMTTSRHGLTSATAVHDSYGESAIHNSLGIVHQELGENEVALAHLLKTAEMRRSNSEPALLASALNNLGIALRSLGRLDEATRDHEEALAIRRATHDEPGQAISLTNLGLVAADQGRRKLALDHLEQAREIAVRIGNGRFEGVALTCAGELLIAMGRPAEAITRLALAVKVLDRLGDAHRERTARNLLATARSALL